MHAPAEPGGPGREPADRLTGIEPVPAPGSIGPEAVVREERRLHRCIRHRIARIGSTAAMPAA
jgi:hypothetical protein